MLKIYMIIVHESTYKPVAESKSELKTKKGKGVVQEKKNKCQLDQVKTLSRIVAKPSQVKT